MAETISKKTNVFQSFPKNFWTAITMEFFERGSYYGVRSILSVYLVMRVAQGGLGFSKESVGVILGAYLYVHFVDNLKNPTMLWIVFSLIGVSTIIGLLLYNKFLAPKNVDA
jgi:hypothetical protein